MADHQPPVGVVMQSLWARYQMVFLQSKHFSQALHPHCSKCSLRQAAIVKYLAANAAKKCNISAHKMAANSIVCHTVFNIRLSFLWLPFVALASLTQTDISLAKSVLSTLLAF